jgi:flagellar protein FliS
MALQKALNIINELQASLDFEQGGQIARNLDQTYSYISQRLLLADFNMDLTMFDEVIRILTELKQAWEYVASNETGAKATPVPAHTTKPREMDRAAA